MLVEDIWTVLKHCHMFNCIASKLKLKIGIKKKKMLQNNDK